MKKIISILAIGLFFSFCVIGCGKEKTELERTEEKIEKAKMESEEWERRIEDEEKELGLLEGTIDGAFDRIEDYEYERKYLDESSDEWQLLAKKIDAEIRRLRYYYDSELSDYVELDQYGNYKFIDGFDPEKDFEGFN